MLSLLFAPDDDPTAGVVAEPPAETPVETPPEPSESVPEQEPTAVPTEDEAVESGAPDEDSQSPDERLEDVLVKLAEDDPERFDRVIAKLPEEQQKKYRGLESERAEFDATKAQDARTTTVQAASTAYQPYSQQVDTGRVEGWARNIVASVQKQAEQAVKDGTENIADLLTEDFVGVVVGLARDANDGKVAQQTYLGSLYENALMSTLEGHAVHRLLTAEERTKLKTVKSVDAIVIYLDAAVRAAPKTKVAAERATDEKTLATAKALKELEGFIGGNGRQATRGGTPSKTLTFEELEHLYAVGEQTEEQEKLYRAERLKRGL